MEAQKTRIEFLQDQFLQDYKKAVKKQKLLDMRSPEFKNFMSKLPHDLLAEFQRMMQGQYVQLPEVGDLGYMIDPAFFAFVMQTNFFEPGDATRLPHQLIFRYFELCDPSTNKEYVQWFMNMYRDLIKQRKPFASSKKVLDSDLIQDGSFSDMLFGGAENRFFEDFGKLTDALERYSFLKKTKVIRDQDKGINRFQNGEAFLKMLKPFLPAEEGSNDVDTLDHKELLAIDNQIRWEKKQLTDPEEARAELVFQNDEWVVVHTINKPANIAFGKYTTWCTAGTRYGSMFDRYDKDGHLFVLVKKGHGSKRSIDRDALVRLQFHFETSQYMDANDKPIAIKQFLNDNKEIKQFFKQYIVKNVLPKKGSKYQQHVELLMNLGYGDELMKIYKEVQPPAIDITGFSLEPAVLEELGEITSLERLTLNDVNMTHLPDSLRNLKKLKYLSCSGNTGLTHFPEWIKELPNLTDLHFSECNIQNQPDLTGLTNLLQITFDFNPNMREFPKGLSTTPNIRRVCASNCQVEEIPDEVAQCKKLYMLDMHGNKKLSKLPLTLTQLPELGALCLDDTMISDADVEALLNNRVNDFTDVIKY